MKHLTTIFSVLLLIIFSFSVVTAQTVEYIGSFDTPAIARSVIVEGDYAYVAEGSSGLQIIDVSDPGNPTLAGSCATAGTAYNVNIVGDYAYVAAGFSGLQVIDISDPEHPALAGSNDTPDRAVAVYVSGAYAYIADKTSLQIFDISDPHTPVSAGYWMLPSGEVTSVYVSGDYAYMTVLSYGLVVTDISDPSQPSLIGSCDMDGSGAYDVQITGNYAYVADGSSVQNVDITAPGYPTAILHCDSVSVARNVYIAENYVYVADFDYGLRVLYTPHPYILNYAAGYETAGNVYDVFSSGNYIYLGGQSSLLILRYLPVDIEDDFSQARAFSLTQNYPNPFNNSTAISYELKQAASVRLDIYDLLGCHIEALLDEDQQAGHHQVIWDADDVASGLYLYKLRAGGHTETKRMILLK